MKAMALTVLLLKEEVSWVAQCLEYDIAAQGSTIKEAQRNFRDVFVGQIQLDLSRKRQPLAGKSKAPDYYWQIFQSKAEQLKNSIDLDSAASKEIGPGWLWPTAEAYVG